MLICVIFAAACLIFDARVAAIDAVVIQRAFVAAVIISMPSTFFATRAAALLC